MEIIITTDYEAMSKTSAAIIAREVKRKHDLVLGLATGDTPLGTYKELARLHKEEGLDFSKVTTFNLDEYLGRTLAESAKIITDIAASKNGKWIVTSSEDRVVRVWEAPAEPYGREWTDVQPREIHLHSPVRGVSIHKDHPDQLVTVSDDGIAERGF